MQIKKRYLGGAILAAASVAISLYLGFIGPTVKPEALVLNFSRGATLSTGERERLLVFAGQHVDEDRLLFHVMGHTGEQGDTNANLALSRQRADFVANELKAAGITADRILSVDGVGAADPLAAEEDQSDRALQRAMARVVVTSLVKK